MSLAQTYYSARPILFVHGFCDTASSWDGTDANENLAREVITAGSASSPLLYPDQQIHQVYYDGQSVKQYPDGSDFLTTINSGARFFAINYYDGGAGGFGGLSKIDPSRVANIPNVNKADELAHVIWAITTATAVKDVIVIGHSMGGLNSRAYLEGLASPAMGAGTTPYAQNVAQLVTVDTPHTGAAVADWANIAGLGPCFAQQSTNKDELRPGSTFINQLNFSNNINRAPTTVGITAIEDYTSPGALPGSFVAGDDGVVTLPEQSIQSAAPGTPGYTDIPNQVAVDPLLSLLAPVPHGCTPLVNWPLHLLTCLSAQSNIPNLIDAQIEPNLSHGQLTAISVSATLDGKPWTGHLAFEILGTAATGARVDLVGSQVQNTFSSVLPGTYTLSYRPDSGGGPSTKFSISQGSNQFLGSVPSTGQNTWTLNFVIAFTTVQIPAKSPVISSVYNAFSGSSNIAPNLWVVVAGTNLAPDTRTWQDYDFANNTMPTVLDGVHVTMSGKNAYVYYASATQLNILTPPDLPVGPVQVQVSNNGVQSAAFTVQVQQDSPSFFTFDGTHVVATHADGSLIGPTSLYPGLSTPAKPNETVILWAAGFGATSVPVIAGSGSQSGTLAPAPVVKIGGKNATVAFAGLVSPGTYQFNVIVPSSLPGGDNALAATYNGLQTQAGVLFSVAEGPPPTVTFTMYPVSGSGKNMAGEIISGPDGALWFTEPDINKIGRMTTSGGLIEYSTPVTPSPPSNGLGPYLASGPDGAIWFGGYFNNKIGIGRMATNGAVSSYPALAAGQITAAPDGALWFVEPLYGEIGRITTAGVSSQYDMPAGWLSRLTVGQDGALWVSEDQPDQIARITTTGKANSYQLATGAAPVGITTGPDGALWFTESGANKIGRITTAGVLTEYSLPTPGTVPLEITAGTDGALWFTETISAPLPNISVGRITTAGTITQYPVPNGINPWAIALGPDGALWFTQSPGGSIGRISLNQQ